MKVELGKYNARISAPTFDFGESILYFDERLIQLVQEHQRPIAFSDPYFEIPELIIYFQENTFIEIQFKTTKDRELFLNKEINYKKES